MDHENLQVIHFQFHFSLCIHKSQLLCYPEHHLHQSCFRSFLSVSLLSQYPWLAMCYPFKHIVILMFIRFNQKLIFKTIKYNYYDIIASAINISVLNVIDFIATNLAMRIMVTLVHGWRWVSVCDICFIYQYIITCGRFWWKENKTSKRVFTFSLLHLSSLVHLSLMKV